MVFSPRPADSLHSGLHIDLPGGAVSIWPLLIIWNTSLIVSPLAHFHSLERARMHAHIHNDVRVTQAAAANQAIGSIVLKSDRIKRELHLQVTPMTPNGN